MEALRDLELLISFRYPIIAVETYEEERVETVLDRIAAKLDIPLFVWTSTDGLRRHGRDTPLYDTHSPIIALGNLAAIKTEGLDALRGLTLFEAERALMGDLPTPEERRDIFAVHLEERGRDPGRFDLAALAEASAGFSGAEIEQAIVSALYTAFPRGSELTTAALDEELGATRPLSVTRREEIDALRAWARERTVAAS